MCTMNTTIFNPAQANFLFKRGAKVFNIVQGKKGEMGVIFDKNDDKLEGLLKEWQVISIERAKSKK